MASFERADLCSPCCIDLMMRSLLQLGLQSTGHPVVAYYIKSGVAGSSSAGIKAMGCGGVARFGFGLLGSPVSSFCIDMCSMFVRCGTGFHTCISGCYFVNTHERAWYPHVPQSRRHLHGLLWSGWMGHPGTGQVVTVPRPIYPCQEICL
eukprot:15353935-Ditylum_brightwellii.AAC.1